MCRNLEATMIHIVGYDQLNKGQDGLRYAWDGGSGTPYIESAAFINKTKNIDSDICGYTTSVSQGCALSKKGLACRFCRTGNCLPYRGLLSEIDIAKQNVFMVLTDLFCEDHPELKTKKREFAYMGQGEPGISYQQVREAIEITNRIMRELHQTVYRHVFATCGIPKAIRNYAEDLQGYFTERVTLHFSLHATEHREKIMPIDGMFSYKESLEEINKIYDISGEKPCIGILLFNRFNPKGTTYHYSNTKEEILAIIRELNPDKCRLSFCEYNPSSELGEALLFPTELAQEILNTAQSEGFEAKLFSSFGQQEKTACGLLGGSEPSHLASSKWKKLDEMANELVLAYSSYERK